MMNKELTVEIFTNGVWQDAYSLTFKNPANPGQGMCVTGYLPKFYFENLANENSRFEHAVSALSPLDIAVQADRGYPAFLLDILPSGAAYRALSKRFGGQKPEDTAMSLFLLEHYTPAPIGNMRIKQSLPSLALGSPMGFDRGQIAEHGTDFLEYAREQGASVVGATGAGGEAPKLLLTEDHRGRMFAEGSLPDEQTKRHWLVKFPRGRVTAVDKDILRAEFHYYRALNEIGMNTVSSEGLELVDDGENSLSLWMHRFDRDIASEGLIRRPVESIYSVCGITEPGAYLSHEFVLTRLREIWAIAGQTDELFDLTVEYLSRDLLNRILGNSDNHGRNTSILRDSNRLRLAPIYDLAPMVLDPEGIVRTTKWRHEKAGEMDWRQACHDVIDQAYGDACFDALRSKAQHFRALPDLLSDLPDSVRNTQSIPLNNLDARLREWGLI